MPSMDEILSSLIGSETEKTANDASQVTEEQVIQKIASDLTVEDIAQLDSLVERHDLEKTASEAEAYGRFMARGFYDEFNKLAACGPKHGTGSGMKKRKKKARKSTGAVHMFMQD